MSSVQKTSEINLAGLVGKPGTDSQLETIATVSKRLDMAGRSLVLRTAIAASQVQNGNKPKSDKPREKSEFVTEVQAKRIVDGLGADYSAEDIVATKLPYDTAYAVVGAIISGDEAKITEQKAVIDPALSDETS